MKLLVVTTDYGDASTGGVETVVSFIVEAVARLTEWHIEIASLRMSHRAEQSRRIRSFSSWFTARHVSTRRFRGVTVHDVGSRIAEYEPARYWPRAWLDELAEGADAVLVVSGSPALCFALRRTRRPVLLQVATFVRDERAAANAKLTGVAGMYRRLMTRLVARLDERGLRVPSVVLAENFRMAEECRRRGVREVELCPPGIDVGLFRPGSARTGDPYILFVGRLSDPRKNVAGLIRAFAKAREGNRFRHNLVLGGFSAPSHQDLELIDQLGLVAAVEVRSPLRNDQLIALYQGADLFASVSHEEGLGLSYLEALSCGVPVITTDNAGAEFILRGSRAGSVVPLGDDFIDRFAAEILRWCEDADLRRTAGIAARELVSSRFSKEVAGRAFIRAIEAVGRRE